MKREEIKQFVFGIDTAINYGQTTTVVTFKNGMKINGFFKDNLESTDLNKQNKWNFNQNNAGIKTDIEINGEDVYSIVNKQLPR
jgi:hypothetical protein